MFFTCSLHLKLVYENRLARVAKEHLLSVIAKTELVCLDDLTVKETWQTPTRDINAKLATASHSHTNIGLLSMIMNCTNKKSCDSVTR